jgi:hypothetical protein
VPWAVLDRQHLGVIEPDDLVLLGLDRRHDVAYPVTTARPSGQTARSVDGRAEPLGHLAEQILLIFTDPRHVAVRPQQRRGHV